MAVRTDPDLVRAPRAARQQHEPRLTPQAQQSRRPRGPRRTGPVATVSAVLVALVLGALLNGAGLERAATALPLGPVRDAAITIATSTARAGAALGFDRPHRWLLTVRDRAFGGDAFLAVTASGGGATGATDDTDGDEGAPTDPVADDSQATADGHGDPVIAGSAADHDRSRRPITADQPLEVLLAGDSLIGAIADGFGRQTSDNALVTWHKDVRISTGLARPDVLDWHLHLQQLLEARDPDVVVLLLGGNDDQSLTGSADGVRHYGQPGWEEEYEARVARLQTIAAGAGRTVVWLEVPAMRPAKLEQARQRMNAAARRAAAATGVLLLDTDLIVAPEGYTTRAQGVQIRADDGVHLTHPGGDLVAEVIDQLLTERYGLPTG